jgi:hypothetical protein
MPSLKNQHFVPRCLLKPFTKNDEGRAINVYNIRADRLIPNAPVKGQCASDYLYGKDGKLETILARTEGLFSAVRGRVLTRAGTEQDMRDLNFFTYLQYRRTEMAASRLKESYQMMNLGIFEDAKAQPIPDKHELVIDSLKFCVETRDYITDLKVRLVEDQSNVDFVISDDPAIFANRFADQRLGKDSFGISSSGILLTMPLTPKLAVICYDGLVYTATDLVDGRFIIKKDSDAAALNEFQNLKAAENLYFSDWEDRDYVREQFLAIKASRPTEWSILKYLVPVDGQDEM